MTKFRAGHYITLISMIIDNNLMSLLDTKTKPKPKLVPPVSILPRSD
ncbi:hypothetical protein PP707_04075 [Acetobacter pasteurianus]|nr:hypothetical protein [Acetobacter pasteurianus]